MYSDEESDGSESELKIDPEDEDSESGADSSDEEENVAPNIDNQNEEVPLDRLLQATYNSADDIRSTLVLYHSDIQRDFRYTQNDGRRIYVVCTDQQCCIVVKWNRLARDLSFT